MKRRILFLFYFCIIISGICKSQDYKFIYYLDVNFATVEKTKAFIIGKGLNENKLFKLDCYSAFNSALLMSIHFTDSSLVELEGPFRSYHSNGKIEKEGNYVSGFEDGTWQTWDSLGRKEDSTFYKNGLPYLNATYSYHKNGELGTYVYKDSLADTFKSTSYNDNAEIESEVFFNGQKGIIKRYSQTGVHTDSLFTRTETEATFPGGEEGWRNYLRKNMNPNVPVDNNAPPGEYTVIVKFIVKEDGDLEDVSVESNPGYAMAKEALRIINNSPKWVPAVQYGQKVKAYRRQPITFLVEN